MMDEDVDHQPGTVEVDPIPRDVDYGKPITGDTAEHVMLLIIKLGEDRNAGGIEPAAEVRTDSSCPPRTPPHS